MSLRILCQILQTITAGSFFLQQQLLKIPFQGSFVSALFLCVLTVLWDLLPFFLFSVSETYLSIV